VPTGDGGCLWGTLWFGSSQIYFAENALLLPNEFGSTNDKDYFALAFIRKDLVTSQSYGKPPTKR